MSTTTTTPAATSATPKSAIPAPPPRPIKARRRPYLVALGVALVALGALAMVYITSSLGQTRTVLALAGPVPRGHVIRATDLVVVDLPTAPTVLQSVSSAELDAVAGQVATVELLAGSLLTPGSYAEALEPAEGTSIVGVALAPSQMPAMALHAGDRVRIVLTPAEGGSIGEETTEVHVTVISMETALVSGQTILNVEVATVEESALLATMAATGRVALILDSVGGVG